MKLLLSAFACEPNKGSEPAIGWNWAHDITRLGHQVWVLTRAHNRNNIEAVAGAEENTKPKFLYYDLPRWAGWWKRGPRGVYLYNLLWQWGAYRAARKHHRRIGFDQVQHITFGSIRQPSFMGGLGIPFLFGPVGGGERAPLRLRRGFGWGAHVKDCVRDLSNALVRADPLVRGTFRRADTILATSEQTRALVPRRFRDKTRTQLAIGLNPGELAEDVVAAESAAAGRAEGFSLIFAGRALDWKGMNLGLPAFARMVKTHPGSRLTIVGKGPAIPRWRRLAERLGVADRIDWVAWIERAELAALYHRHHAFLFPSLHDSGGIAVLEALSKGLPVVALDIGGPGRIVDPSCGVTVETVGRSRVAVVAALAEAMERLAAADADVRARLSEGARQRARAFTWSDAVGKCYRAAG